MTLDFLSTHIWRCSFFLLLRYNLCFIFLTNQTVSFYLRGKKESFLPNLQNLNPQRHKILLPAHFSLMVLLCINFRCHYLSNAVLQAKNASTSDGLVSSTRGAVENGLLDLLEGKLAVLRFQIKIKEELEAKASRLEASSGASDTVQNGTDPESTALDDANLANNAREKAKELSLDLKSITQLYNDYAVPFELWEVLRFFFFLIYFWLNERNNCENVLYVKPWHVF